MNRLKHLKICCLLLCSFFCSQLILSQTKIAELTFETTGGYTTNVLEHTNTNSIYFIRTDGSNISPNATYSNLQGNYFFGAQNVDDEPDGTRITPQVLTFDDINISGYTNLEFRVHLAEASDGSGEHWDENFFDNDYVRFRYDIDNTGSFNNLLWVEAVPNFFGNQEPRIDTDFDGEGDGIEITSAFTQFTQPIIGTGFLLDIQIAIDLDKQYEDIAIDNIEIWGIGGGVCSTITTWNGANWDNGNPNIAINAVVDADYDMTILPSFTACSLIVNNGATIIVDDSKYIEINDSITINGNIIVRPNGSVLQHDENAIVIGDASVEKMTAVLNNWYEYTYWSSPVFGETIETALSDSNSNRRYWFDASNFIDAFMETNNDNNLVPGQDDIDDDANDWQHASGTMIPGVGYAATHSEIAFTGPGNQYKYTFNGPFNNGIFNVPVVRNDTELNDLNWNFIGNPYPSAIDMDLFFSENNYDATLNPAGLLEGAVYLWSQNTQPSGTNNGNEGQNFANSDYAIINGVGQNPGGDGLTPNRYIPSGQGFFTVFSDNASSSTGNVIFNNSMRISGNNDQFFRSNNNSQFDKLSLKLISDNGLFNQLLIGYVDGATDAYDGMYYDAPRNLSTGTAAIIYSTIEDNSRKYAIQGKDPISLNENEVIAIGFKNTIEIDTQFILSIANAEGDFMNSNPIFLRDNLLNLEHDLKASNYEFTSNVGEFNNRFEIHFTNALSMNEFVSEQNQLIVSTHQQELNFSTTKHSIIANVKIFDLLGRLLYNIDFNETSASIKTKELLNSILVAKVTLDNGRIITRKIMY